MNEGEFLELIKTMAAEFEQLLNVMEMGDRDSMQLAFQNLLEVVFWKIASLLAAESVGIVDGPRWSGFNSPTNTGHPERIVADLRPAGREW